MSTGAQALMISLAAFLGTVTGSCTESGVARTPTGNHELPELHMVASPHVPQCQHSSLHILRKIFPLYFPKQKKNCEKHGNRIKPDFLMCFCVHTVSISYTT